MQLKRLLLAALCALLLIVLATAAFVGLLAVYQALHADDPAAAAAPGSTPGFPAQLNARPAAQVAAAAAAISSTDSAGTASG